MGFEARGNNTNIDDAPRVDYKAMNKYMVETCGLEKEKTVVGIVSGIVDLGLQQQEDAMVEYNGTEEQEREETASKPQTYFETIGGKRYKRWPQKPQYAVAITVDFPGIIVDKGQFYDNSNPAPLRICLNGQFWRKELGVMGLGRIFTLTLRKNDKTHDKWSLLPNNTLYKMAVGSGIIEQGEAFLPKDIDNLLGKALLFKARVWFNGEYYSEKITYAAGLVEGMPVPEYDESLLYSVGFMSDNDDKSIKFLTNPIINTMKMSSEWEGSKVQEQIERVKGYSTKGNNQDTDDSTDEYDDLPF